MEGSDPEELLRSFRRFRTFAVVVSGGPPIGFVVWGLIRQIGGPGMIQGSVIGLGFVILLLGIPLYLYREFVRSPFGSLLFGIVLVAGMLLLPLYWILFTPIQWSVVGIGIIYWIPVTWVVALIGMAIDVSILYPIFEGRGRTRVAP
jgi:hypothetical protein